MERSNPHKLVMSEEQRFQVLVENIIDYAIYMLDENGNVASWNAGAQRIKGYARAEIVGRNFSMFFPEDARRAGKPEELLNLARTTGRAEDEGWRVRKDGSRFWATAIIDAIRDEAGHIIGFAKITRDVTDRRETQQKLADSERTFRLLVSSVTDHAIFMLDPDGRVTSWNSGAQRIKGYTEAEILGRHFSCFYMQEDRDSGRPMRSLQRAAAEGKHESEGWRVRKDGSRFWANVVIERVVDETGTLVGFAKITRDVTERRRANLELERARNQLFQSQKLEALGQTAGGVAHDFNNLMAVILSGVAMLTKLVEANERAQWILGEIKQAATRGSELTRQMLAFSRAQPMQVEAIDVAERLRQVEKLLKLSVRGDIRLSMELTEGLWPIEVDGAQLELALLNVGVNARDAMPKGGTLTVTARNLTMTDSTRGLNGDYVAISATDTGEGIAADVLPMVFDPFFTTKEVGKGTGLGLSQAYGFAKQMGGTVTIDSEVGKGTTVTFYLPAAKSARVSAAPEPAVEPVASRNHGTILFVEDTAQLASLTAAFLKETGYQVKHVASAADALALLRRGSPVDLVFSDIILPGGMNGVELAEAVRAEAPGLPIMLTTGFSTAVQDIPAGIPLVVKPYDLGQVADTIARLILERERRPGARR